MNIAFIGLGLIGGSVAKALHKRSTGNNIIAYDKNEGTLRMAQSEGVISYGNTEIDDRLNDCDVIFLCAPVDNNKGLLSLIKKHIKKGAVLTDVGSVKGPIHDVITDSGLSEFFVGGHPMAGSEKSGYANATDHLLENAFYIITNENKDYEGVAIMEGIIRQIGAIPLFLPPKEHDIYTAAISHLPHLIAASLVNLVKDNDSAEGYMRLIAAGGFKDITRIASSDPVMWQQICNENGDNIHLLLEKYIEALKDIDAKLIAHDENFAHEMFSVSRDYRDSFDDLPKGPIKKLSCIYCDVVDESGAIATIATLLANNQINIKNIGIVHNREFQNGALRIVFDNDGDAALANTILTDNNYTIYKRS